MYEEVIGKIMDTINETGIFTESYPKFSGEGYRAHKIDIENFQGVQRAASGKKIAFIDGGNSEIMGSANFTLSLIRVCYIVYKNNKKIDFKKFETLAFTKAENKNDEIYFKTTFFNVYNTMKFDEISFNSLDHTLMHGVNRAEISNVTNAIRRLAELQAAKYVSDDKLCDIIVLDGSLQCTMTNENKYLDELYESCAKNNVVLGALSKTSSIFTDNGNLLSAVLSGLSKLDLWFYHPIVDISSRGHKAEMFFVKLHEKSRHVFRFEIFNQQKMMAAEAISGLACSCIDPIFFGYPYGLVEADRIARVSKQEQEFFRTMLKVKLKGRNIDKYLNAVNAHAILDKISF